MFVILVLLLILNVLEPSETRIYLEIVDRSIEAADLFEHIINGDTAKQKGQEIGAAELTVELYECEESPGRKGYENVCEPVYDREMKRNIYSAANFYHVPKLEFPGGHTFTLRRKEYHDQLPQALTIGVESIGPKYLTQTLPGYEVTDRAADQVNRYLGRFIDSGPKTIIMQDLHRFFSIAHWGWLRSRGNTVRLLFTRYVTVLQRVMKDPEYKKLAGSRFSQTGTEMWSNFSKYFSPIQSVVQTLAHSCRTRSQPRAHQHEPESQFRTPSKHPSMAQSSDAGILEAVNMLVFKMLDPCFYFLKAGLTEKEAEPYCTTYCQFISATMQVRGQKDQECENLRKGSCTNAECKCLPRHGTYEERVNMVQCNNSLRLYIYRQAGLNLSPKG